MYQRSLVIMFILVQFSFLPLISNPAQASEESKPYEALTQLSESYFSFKDPKVYDGIVKSVVQILSWSVGSHGRGEFAPAIYGYSTIINNSFVPVVVKDRIKGLLTLAQGKQLLTKQKYQEIMNSAVVDTSKALYTYDEMIKDIQELQFIYGNQITVSSIGKSVLGQELPVIILGNPNASKKIFVQGSMHAREYITTLLIMRQLEFYLQNYYNGYLKTTSFKEILNKTAIHYIPMVNPDGVTLSQKGISWIADQQLKERLVAMNKGSLDFHRWKANIVGTDLNRNFKAKWETLTDDLRPGPLNYKGLRPESEPETRALANYTLLQNFDASISYHATGSIIYWYFYQTGARLERDRKLLKGLLALSDYHQVPPKKNVRSVAGYGDWFIQAFGKPNFTIEIGNKNSQTPLKISEFPDIWKKNKYTAIYLADSL